MRTSLEEGLRSALAVGEGTMIEAARGLVLAPSGKRLRPELALTVAEALGAPALASMRVAVAAELMHAASLLHDDVVDEGRVRRGVPTANARFGNAVAVLAGDYVLTRALDQLVALPGAIMASALAVAAEMTRAAIAEIEARGRADLTLDEWRSIAEGKTGALFAWCGRAPAMLAEREGAARALDAFGRHLGVAFQIADDLRDLIDPASGKDTLSDLRSATPSSVLILAARRDPSIRGALDRLWSAGAPREREVGSIARAVMSSGALGEAQALASIEIERAGAALASSGVARTELASFGATILRGAAGAASVDPPHPREAA